LGAPDPIDPNPLERYGRASEPIAEDGEGVYPSKTLIGMLEQAQERFGRILQAMLPTAQLQQVAFLGRRTMSINEWLLFFYVHDPYHTGQTELLRRAAGRNEKVIQWRRGRPGFRLAQRHGRSHVAVVECLSLAPIV
jgi:hypothetical protein